MMIFVGFGNFEVKYFCNRYNVGFMVLDVIVQVYYCGFWCKCFQGLVMDLVIGLNKFFLFKFQIFYNNFGYLIGEVVNFFKVDLFKVVVFYDELDLVLGKFCLKKGGGVVGNNGIKFIISQLGLDFLCGCIGVGYFGDCNCVIGYVFLDFFRVEENWLIDLLDVIVGSIDLLGKGEFDVFQIYVIYKVLVFELVKCGLGVKEDQKIII